MLSSNPEESNKGSADESDRVSRSPFRSTSLRAILLVPFVVQMVLTSVAIAWLSFYNSERAVNEIATRLRVEISARIIERLERYLTTPVPILELNSLDIQDGRLDVQNIADLEAQFFEESLVFDSVDQLYFGRADGEYVGVATLKDGSRDLDVTEGTGNLNSYLLDAAGNRVSLARSTPYDPRDRPWYRAAIEAEGLVWSPIYAWASVDTYGITLSKPEFDDAGNVLGVLGVDLSLVKINDFLRGLNVSHTGKVFILERSGDLVASSTPQIPFRQVGDRIERIDIVNIRDPLIRNTVNFLNREYESLALIQDKQSLSFEFQDDIQYVQITPWQDAYGLDWIVAIVVPSSDFLIQIERNTRVTLVLCIATILVSLVAGIYLSKRISDPIRKLNEAVKGIARGSWSQISAPSRISEVQELSQSFNRMSASLHDSFTQLEQVLAERTDDLDVSQRRYRSLFDDAPNPLWEVDFSVVYFYLKELQHTQSISDFSQYFNEHPEAIAICADLVKILDVNQAAERFLDASQKKEAIAMLPRAYRAEARHIFQAELISLLDGHASFESEIETQTLSGNQKDAILKHFIAPSYEDNWSRVLIAVVDISDRRQVERALQENQQKLDAIFNNTFQFIGLMSPDGTLIEINQVALDAIAAERADVLHRPLWEAAWWKDSSENQDTIREMTRRAAVGEFARQELIITDGDGLPLVLDVSIKPVFDRAGQVTLLIPEGRDITHLKETELQLLRRSRELSATLEQLKETQADLIESAKKAALANTVAGVAHEINTPVGTAITISSTLENASEAIATKFETGSLKRSELQTYVETATECSQLILSNLNRAGDLVRSFKQIAVDRTHDKARTFVVFTYLENLVTSLSHEIKSAGHVMSVAGDREADIHSYPGALAQVITNLVMNSIAHAYPNRESGTLTLTVESDRDEVVLTYADDGCGIAEADLGRIFEPFFTTASHAGGSGLGLHITYSLVTGTLQGAIAVRSEVGVGTSFVMTLPIQISSE